MQFIKNQSDNIILGIDNMNLHYFTGNPEQYIGLNEEERMAWFQKSKTTSVTLDCLEKDSGNRLVTILEHLKEQGFLSDTEFVLYELENCNLAWKMIVGCYREAMKKLEQRVVLMEQQSGSADGWVDILYLNPEENSFHLMRCRYDYMTAVEKLDKFPVETDPYWKGALANGEYIEDEIKDIDSASSLYNALLTMTGKKETCCIAAEDIDWEGIIAVLLASETSLQLGLELRSFLTLKE